MIIFPESVLSKLNPGQRLLFEELVRRGAIVSKLEKTNIYRLRLRNREQYMIGRFSSLVPYNIGLILSNKNFIREILINGELPVADGKLFMAGQDEEASVYTLKLGFPVFIRQENAQREEKGIVIKTKKDFRSGFLKLAGLGECILVEKYFQGDNYRVFYTRDGFFNCLKNESGINSDVTSTAHPSVMKIAAKVLKCFPGMGFAAFRILSNNIKKEMDMANCIIGEVYPSWGDSIYHDMVRKKEKMPALQIIADLLFP